MLILCGSAQTFMKSLEAEHSALHGRFTGTIHVGPLDYRSAALFHPTLAPADQARAYGILGGTPLYVQQWNPTLDVRENLLHLFADPTSGLVDSAELVLTTDLPDSKAGYRVLQAIGLGKNRFSEIRDYAKVTSERLLQRFVKLGLIERRLPATEDPLRSKRSLYVIRDPHLRFFFRFIARNRGAIDRGLGASVIDGQILPYLETYMGDIFEEMAREYVRILIARGQYAGDDVTSWWSTDGNNEIDIVGTRNVSHPTVVGSVKWREKPLDRRILQELDAGIRAMGIPADIRGCSSDAAESTSPSQRNRIYAASRSLSCTDEATVSTRLWNCRV